MLNKGRVHTEVRKAFLESSVAPGLELSVLLESRRKEHVSKDESDSCLIFFVCSVVAPEFSKIYFQKGVELNNLMHNFQYTCQCFISIFS